VVHCLHFSCSAKSGSSPPVMATLQFSEGSDNRPAIRHRSKQLINNIIDGTAKERPRALYAEIPRLSDSYEGGYRPITYRALANAINGVAWFLKENLGKREVNHTLAYFGPNDIGYVVMVLGAVKAGHRVCLSRSAMKGLMHANAGQVAPRLST